MLDLELLQHMAPDQARSNLIEAVGSNPLHVQAWSLLGSVCYQLGEMDQAIAHLKQAIEVDEEFAPAYLHLSKALLAVGQNDDAIAVLCRATQVAPGNANLWCDLGVTYKQNHQQALAMAALKKAINLDSTLVDAYCHLASCYQDLAQVGQAADIYQEALFIDESRLSTVSDYLCCLQFNPEKTDKELLGAAKKVLAPIRPKSTCATVEQQAFAGSKHVATKAVSIRIGFVIADFTPRSTASLFCQFFCDLAQLSCDCYCYVNSTEQNMLTEQVKRYAHRWREIYGQSTTTVVQIIKDDDIDLLIDLCGHTPGNRLDVFAQRAASLQLSWLGYPATTGVAAIDGVILGHDLLSSTTQSHFTESVLSLEASQFSYAPPVYLPYVGEPAFKRRGFITFGCFDNTAKFNDSVLLTWANLMRRVKDSRIVLQSKSFADKEISDHFHKRFITLGITADRVILEFDLSHRELLALYNDIDIALDPFPYSSAVSSLEAIWMNVPVVTLFSDRVLSRQTYAINQALGLSQLCCQSTDEYIETASHLAIDKDRLLQMRYQLRKKIQTSALADTKTNAKAFYELLLSTYKQHTGKQLLR